MTIGRSTPRRRILAGAALTGALALVLAGCTGTPGDTTSQSPSGDGGTSTSETGTFETRQVDDGTTAFTIVENPGDGPRLCYGTESSITILEEADGDDTYAFKDMNGNATLDTWEDWRLSTEERAAALAQELTTEQLAGLMLFSNHERAPQDRLTDGQRTYLEESHVRNVLNSSESNIDVVVPWVNQMQAYAEGLADGLVYVPINFSSDPRSTAGSGGYNAAGADISRWPSNLGLAATFDVDHMRNHAEMASAEYRALGIATALGPQIDLATEPRWLRVGGTFGEDVDWSSELTRAYVQGFQGSGGTTDWGTESVNAMIKHWSGDGPGEGGRESHTDPGQYAVYPVGNHDAPVTAFADSLDSASIMTAFGVAVDANGDPVFSDLVGASYDQGRMDLLREDYGYEGVVVTDWGTMESITDPEARYGMAWGVADLTPGERYYQVLHTGHDMFGGVNDATYVNEAYDLWQEKFEAGEVDIDAETRFRQSGERIAKRIIAPGLYECAYLDPEESREVLASVDKVEAGYLAQLDSVVMLKNDSGAIAAAEAADWADKTVYIPRTYDVGFASMRGPGEYNEGSVLDLEVAEEYFAAVLTDEAELDADGKVVSYTAPDLTDVDLVLVGMDSPNNGSNFTGSGYDADADAWYPLSLQYRPYTADGPNVRQTSISGDILEDGSKENRSYYGNTSVISNEAHLDAHQRAVAAVEASGKDIPVITVLKAINPVVPAEFEGSSDAIVVGFGTNDAALFEVALGLHEPAGRLPMQFPANMDTVEAQLEDVGKDMTPYTDSAGNAYDYGFGLSYSGPIS